MIQTPHKDKLEAALLNPKCSQADKDLLKEALKGYLTWIQGMVKLNSKGKKRVEDMTRLLNEYKDFLEVELIAQKGSDFLKRQKGQLKLDKVVSRI